MVRKIILDAGNGIIKAKAREGEEVEFPHAIAQLTHTQWDSVLARNNGKAPADYIKINDTPFAVGKSAEAYKIAAPLQGNARYRREYYGVLAVMAFAKLYDESKELFLFAGHPPADVAFRESLGASVKGHWDVLYRGNQVAYHVSAVDTWEEPEGGLFNALLKADGKEYAERSLNEGTTLVIDIGRGTTDFLGMQPGGEIDESVRTSVNVGIGDVLRNLERSFLDTYRIPGVQRVPPDRLRAALLSGVIQGGGETYDVVSLVDEATNMLLNNIHDAYTTEAGGRLRWDNILLTGGGSGLLSSRLDPVLNHTNIHLAEKDVSSIHMANVRGALKLFKMLTKAGVYDG